MQRDEVNDEQNPEDIDQQDDGNRISPKQRVLDNQGKQVPVDLFLYSCLEIERTNRSMEAAGTPRIEWAAIAGQITALPEDMENLPLALILKKLVTWYRQKFPELSNSQPIDHERLLDVVEPLIALNLDLGKVYRLKNGEDLPEYESSVGNNRAWDDIYTEIRDQFPAYQHLYNRYIQWSHAAEPVEIFEPGSRPPVGRYAPPPIRRPTSGGPRGGRDDRGPRGGGGRDDRGPRGPRRETGGGAGGGSFSGGRPPREANGNNRFESRPPPRRGEGEGRGPRQDRPDHNRPDRNGPRGPKVRDEAESAKLEEAAIRDVNEAIKTLKNDSSQSEMVLKPMNSFYRRLQHQCVVEAGFNSTSVGEGPDRAVRVSRK